MNLPTASTTSEHAMRMRYLEAIDAPLMTHLGELADGSLIIDLACGAGEPALPLARRHPRSRVLGIDQDAEAVAAAQHAAADERLGSAEF